MGKEERLSIGERRKNVESMIEDRRMIEESSKGKKKIM